ncbi:MAG: ABC transporter permease, partial [Solirubrobacteraceae bacterium]
MTEPEAPLLEGLGDAAGMPIGAPEGGEVQIIASGWNLALREFFDNKLAVVGLVVIVFFILFCFIGPLFDSTNQTLVNPLNTDLAPGGHYLLGTDEHGFDEFGRIMLGGQTALEIG